MSSVMELIFFFKQKTAYEMRISDWSSDVCSSDLRKQFFRHWPSQSRKPHRNVDRADRPDRTRNDRLPIGDRPSPVAGGRSQAPTAGDRRSTKPTRMVSARAAGRRAEGDHRVFRGQDRTERTRGEPHADTAPAEIGRAHV